MRLSLLASATALFLTAAGCSNTAPPVPTGEGGATGTGGSSSGGSTGSGGSSVAGSTGSGGAGGAVDLTSVAASFDGQLLQFPCGASHSGYDCDNVGCTNSAVTHSMTYPIK